MDPFTLTISRNKYCLCKDYVSIWTVIPIDSYSRSWIITEAFLNLLLHNCPLNIVAKFCNWILEKITILFTVKKARATALYFSQMNLLNGTMEPITIITCFLKSTWLGQTCSSVHFILLKFAAWYHNLYTSINKWWKWLFSNTLIPRKTDFN